MRLSEWCREQGITLTEAGRQLGVERKQTIWKYATGRIRATPELIANAEVLTGGKVTAKDWVFDSSEGEAAA